MQGSCLFICIIFFACFASIASAQDDEVMGDTVLLRSLEEVTVKSTRLPANQLRTARSIYRRDLSEDNQFNMHLAADEVLWHLPGVYAVNPYNFSQDLRISVRGFGSRSAFGVRGLKIIVDGVPATTPDGQSQLDHLDPQQLSSAELISGAAGSLYGNAAGGVIDLRSKVYDKSVLGGQVQLGNNGLTKISITGAKVNDDETFQGSLGYLGYQGYRQHSSAATIVGNAAWLKNASKGGKIAVRLNWTHSPQAQDPGGINIAQVEEDRRSARDRNILFDGGEEISRGSLSLTYESALLDNRRYQLNAYYVFRDFNNRLPFENGGMVSFFRNYGGLQGQFSHHGANGVLLLGIDAEWQADRRKRYNNVQGERGPKTLDQLEQFALVGLFGQWQWHLQEQLTAELATRLDLIQTSVGDHFISDGDQSGDRGFAHLSPSLGLNYAWSKRNHVFIQYGHSFETPSLSELSNNPDGVGGFNTDLQPQIANHYEFGLKGQHKYWRYHSSIFFIALQNELIPFELADFPGRTFYQNSGKSTRAGVELSLEANPFRNITLKTAQTFSQFKFREFVVEGEDLEGRKLPGVPEYFSTLAAQYDHSDGWFFSADVNVVGSVFANNDNSVKVNEYALVHMRTGKKWKFTQSALSLHIGIRNLTGTKYFDNIRSNAFGSRFYEPGPEQQFFAGISFEIF